MGHQHAFPTLIIKQLRGPWETQKIWRLRNYIITLRSNNLSTFTPMKKSILLLLMLFSLSFSIAADSENPPVSDNAPVKLTPIRRPGKGPSRMPALPLYGEYVNPVVRVFVAHTEESVYTLTISKDNLEIESVSLSGAELNAGYEVSISAPFEIELSTDGGVSYAGEVL